MASSSTVIVRSGWIFGRGGTNFLSVIDRSLAERKQISVIQDAWGTPTFAVDLAGRVRELAEMDLPGIYHVTNSGEGTSYLGFAEAICEIAGFDPELVRPIGMEELQRPAPRPRNSKLRCLISEGLGLAKLRTWQDALREYLG